MIEDTIKYLNWGIFTELVAFKPFAETKNQIDEALDVLKLFNFSCWIVVN